MATKTPKPGAPSGAPRVPPHTAAKSASKTEKKIQAAANNTPLWVSALKPVVSALDWMFGTPPPSARKEHATAKKFLDPAKSTPAAVAAPAINAAGAAASKAPAAAATPERPTKPVAVISPVPAPVALHTPAVHAPPATPASPHTPPPAPSIAGAATPAKVTQVAADVLSPATPHTPSQPKAGPREPPSTIKDSKRVNSNSRQIASLQSLLARILTQPEKLQELQHALVLSTTTTNNANPIQIFLLNNATPDSPERGAVDTLCDLFNDFPELVHLALTNIKKNSDKQTAEALQKKAKEVLEFCKKFEDSRKNAIKYIATNDSVVDLHTLEAALLEKDPASTLRRILDPIAGKIDWVGRNADYDFVLQYAANHNILTDWTKFVLESALNEQSVVPEFKQAFKSIIFAYKAKPFIDRGINIAAIAELEMALVGTAQNRSSPQKSAPKPLRDLLAEKTPDGIEHFQHLPDNVLRKLALLALEQKLTLSPPNAVQIKTLLEQAAKQDAEAIIRQKIAEIVEQKNKDMAAQFVDSFDRESIRSCFDNLSIRIDAQMTRELASAVVDALPDDAWIVANLKPIFLGKSVLQTLIKNALSTRDGREKLISMLIEVEKEELKVERNKILLNSGLFEKESDLHKDAIKKFAGQNDLADFIRASLEAFTRDTSLPALQQGAQAVLIQLHQFDAFKTEIVGVAGRIDISQVEHALLSDTTNGSLPGNPVDNALYDILDNLRPRMIGVSTYRQALNNAKTNITFWTMIVLQRYDQTTKEGPHNPKIGKVLHIYEEKQAIEALIPLVIGEQGGHPVSSTVKILRIEELGALLVNNQDAQPGEAASAAGTKNINAEVYNYFVKLAHLKVIPLKFLQTLQHASQSQHLRELVVSALQAELTKALKSVSSNAPLPIEISRLQGVVQYIAYKEAERIVKAKLPEIVASLDKANDPLAPNLLKAFFANDTGHALQLFFTTMNSSELNIDTQTLRNLVVFSLQDYVSQHPDTRDKVYTHLLKPISDWEVTKTAKSLSYFCLTQLFIPEPNPTKSAHSKTPAESYNIRCLRIVQDMISESHRSFRAAIAKRFPELTFMQRVSIYFNNLFKSSILEYFISRFIFNLVEKGIRDKATPDFLRTLPKEALTTLSTSLDNYESQKTLGRDLDATNAQEDGFVEKTLVDRFMGFVPKCELESYITDRSKNLFLGKFLLWQWQPASIFGKLLKGAYYVTIILPLGSALIGLLGLFAGWAAGILLDIPINQYVTNRARKAFNDYIPLITTSSFEGLSQNTTKMAILSWLCEKVRETALTSNLPQKAPENPETLKLIKHTLKGLLQTFKCLEGEALSQEVADDDQVISDWIDKVLAKSVTADGVKVETAPKTKEALKIAANNIIMAIYNTTQGFTSIENREGTLYLIMNLINYVFDPTTTTVSNAELNAKKAEIRALASVMTAFTSAQETRAEVERQVTETLDQNPWKKWALEMVDKVDEVHDKAEKRALPFAFACAEPLVLNFMEGLMNAFVNPQLCHTITIHLEKTLLAKVDEKAKAQKAKQA